ncbi:DivIVA domain-containing protein, partial [bacterium]|nr:DivIVA domain-containing protein [bacterium]
MKLTPLDIQQHQFAKKSNRYDAPEVDSFLDMVRRDYEESLRINEELKEQNRKLDAQLSELRANERVLKDAIISTQKVSDEIKKNAEKEAEVIIAEAQLKAEKIIDNGRREVETLHSDIMELKRQRVQFEATLRATLEGHEKLLEATSDRIKEEDAEAAKVK